MEWTLFDVVLCDGVESAEALSEKDGLVLEEDELCGVVIDHCIRPMMAVRASRSSPWISHPFGEVMEKDAPADRV